MNGIRAALLALSCLGLANLPTAAPAADSAVTPEKCEIGTCADSTVTRTANGWNLHVRIGNNQPKIDFFNLRVFGNEQLRVEGPGNQAELDVAVPAGWDGTFAVEACRDNRPLESVCDSWINFPAGLPVADNDENFCSSYASTATSQGTQARQQNCGFETTSRRWSTDNLFHLNWCLGQFRGAGGVASKLTAARNLANSEEATRVDGLNTCQAGAEASAADRKAFADQVANEVRVTGKTVEQCQASNNSCELRMRALGAPNAPECATRLQICLTNAVADKQAAVANRNFETQVTGKTVAECQLSNQACEGRIRSSMAPGVAPAVIASQCAPYLPICIANAVAAAKAAASNEDTADSQGSTDTGDGMADTSTGDDMADAPANTARVMRTVNVHRGDVKRKDDVVGSLAAGTTVEYFECDKSACRIPFEGEEGFVARSFLDFSGGDGPSAGGGFKVEIPLPGKNKKVVITAPDAQGGVAIIEKVTGYDAPGGGGNDKCYLNPGETAELLGVDEGDPTWKHLRGTGACDGQDFWVYDDGKLRAL